MDFLNLLCRFWSHTLGIPVSYLFIPPHSTPEERLILAMLEVGE